MLSPHRTDLGRDLTRFGRAVQAFLLRARGDIETPGLRRHGSLSPGRWRWMGRGSARVSTTLNHTDSVLGVACSSRPASPSCSPGNASRPASPARLLSRPAVRRLSCSPAARLPQLPRARSWRRRDHTLCASLPPQAKAYHDSANPAMESLTVLLILAWYICNIGVLLLNKYLLSFYGFRWGLYHSIPRLVPCRVIPPARRRVSRKFA